MVDMRPSAAHSAGATARQVDRLASNIVRRRGSAPGRLRRCRARRARFPGRRLSTIGTRGRRKAVRVEDRCNCVNGRVGVGGEEGAIRKLPELLPKLASVTLGNPGIVHYNTMVTNEATS